MNINAGMCGKYRLQVVKQDGSIKSDTGYFDNLITNYGMNQWATGNANLFNYISVGRGTTPPAVTDTALGTFAAIIVATANRSFYWNNPFTIWRMVATFTVGAVTGNITEVGVGYNSAGANLFSRALVKDISGNPVTVTVLADESLIVTYELWIKLNVDDTVSTVNGYTTTLRPSGLGTNAGNAYACQSAFVLQGSNAPQTAAAVLGNGSLTNIVTTPGTLANSSYTHSTYVNDSYTRTTNFVWLPTTGPMSVTTFAGTTGPVCYQASFSPPIQKTATNSLTLSLTYSWARDTGPTNSVPSNPNLLPAKVRYDINDLSTLYKDSAGTIPATAVGDPIGRVVDLSGNNNHFVQTVDAKRPLLGQDVNGDWYIEGDGVSMCMETLNNLPGGGGAWEMFTLGVFTKSPTGAGVVYCHGPSLTTQGVQYFYENTQQYTVGGYSNLVVNTTGNVNNSEKAVLSTKSQRYPAYATVIRKNKAILAGSFYSTNPPAIALSAKLHLFSITSTSSFNASRLYYFSVLQNEPTFEQIRSGEHWLANEYNIQVGLW